MPRSKNTWQERGEYLADCCGLTATQFAAGIDTAMSGNRGNIAAKPASGRSTGAGGKTPGAGARPQPLKRRAPRSKQGPGRAMGACLTDPTHRTRRPPRDLDGDWGLGILRRQVASQYRATRSAAAINAWSSANWTRSDGGRSNSVRTRRYWENGRISFSARTSCDSVSSTMSLTGSPVSSSTPGSVSGSSVGSGVSIAFYAVQAVEVCDQV